MNGKVNSITLYYLKTFYEIKITKRELYSYVSLDHIYLKHCVPRSVNQD